MYMQHEGRLAAKIMGIFCSVALSATLASCAGSKPSDSASSAGDTMTGISAEGKPGQKPKVTFKTPLDFKDKAHEVIQKGDGDVVQDGDRLCVQDLALDSKDGKEIYSTWEGGHADCAILVDKEEIPAYYDVFKGQRLNSTIAIGIKDETSGKTGNSNSQVPSSYIMAITLVSKSKELTRAKGDKVSGIPSDLPKVTLDDKGKPSLDLNGYHPGNKLVVQTLIKGKGAKVESSQTVRAHYTGWLASSGKQFDSSWDRGKPTPFGLNQVIKGWTQGLTGQTVGSQVLLVIPPNLGYGSQSNDKIPANSTLIFVIDIIAAY